MKNHIMSKSLKTDENSDNILYTAAFIMFDSQVSLSGIVSNIQKMHVWSSRKTKGFINNHNNDNF